VLECWSVGVLECWSVGFELVEDASIPSLQQPITPIPHYSITPLLHYSTRPRPWCGSGSIAMRDSDFPIRVHHDAGDSSEAGILIEVTQKVDTAKAELQCSGKINQVISRGQT
jgi:hypothetical protein